MFEQTFVNTRAQAGRPWSVAASLMLQTGVVGVLVIYPLLHPEVLHPKLDVPIWVPRQPVVSKLESVPKSAQRPATSSPRPVFPQPLTMPTTVPARVARIEDVPPAGDAIIAGPGPASGAGALLNGLTQLLPERPPQPAAVPKPQPAPPPAGPIHVGTGIQSAKLIFGPTPLYPPIARAARVQGTVKIQAIIASNGSIQNLRVISGPPLLIEVALSAVKQWRYQPTMLNGNAVQVITEIDVVFTLSR